MGSYVPATSSEQQEMLEAIGLRDFPGSCMVMYRKRCTCARLWTFRKD